MAPVPPSQNQKKQQQNFSYLTQVMPPPAVPTHQYQRNSFMAFPTASQFQNNANYQQAPHVQNMTLNIDQPGTYAITLNYQPCPESVQQAQRNMMGQMNQMMYNSFLPRR